MKTIENKLLWSKRILLLVFGIVFLIGMVSAEVNEFAPVKQGDCVTIKQVCASCSYVNLSVSYPNSTLAVTNKGMASIGGGTWSYYFCNTTALGRYDVTGSGDLSGVNTAFDILFFYVTPSGNNGNSNIVFFIFLIVILYAVTFISFFGKNIPISILSGMAMMFLGIYTVRNGIIIFRDTLTNYFSYLTIAIGAIIALWAAVEWIEDIM